MDPISGVMGLLGGGGTSSQGQSGVGAASAMGMIEMMFTQLMQQVNGFQEAANMDDPDDPSGDS
jgi:hypothetical protein